MDTNVNISVTRYAPYIENRHSDFLAVTAGWRKALINDSPYVDYTPIEVNEALLGLGYLISDFPSLYDMFGKHMAGLDIDSLWNSVFEKVFDEPTANASIVENIKLIDDKIVKEDLSELQVRMRNLNAVTSSSFIIGKAVVEDKRIKSIAKLSLAVKVELLDTIGRNYAKHLTWERALIIDYAKAMKDYFIYTSIINNVNTKFASRSLLWPFTVLSFEQAALGVMQSTRSWDKDIEPKERSQVSKLLVMAQGAVTGATIGFEVGGVYGAIGGAVIGWQIGIAQILLENSSSYWWIGFIDPLLGSWFAQES